MILCSTMNGQTATLIMNNRPESMGCCLLRIIIYLLFIINFRPISTHIVIEPITSFNTTTTTTTITSLVSHIHSQNKTNDHHQHNHKQNEDNHAEPTTTLPYYHWLDNPTTNNGKNSDSSKNYEHHVDHHHDSNSTLSSSHLQSSPPDTDLYTIELTTKRIDNHHHNNHNHNEPKNEQQHHPEQQIQARNSLYQFETTTRQSNDEQQSTPPLNQRNPKHFVYNYKCPKQHFIHPCDCIELDKQAEMFDGSGDMSDDITINGTPTFEMIEERPVHPDLIETVALCKNIRNVQVLTTAIQGFQKHRINYFIIDGCKLPPFPNNLFKGIHVVWMEILNSTLQFHEDFFLKQRHCP